MLILQLEHPGGLQHAAARSEKEQIVINQGRRQRLGLAAEKSTGHWSTHAAIAATCRSVPPGLRVCQKRCRNRLAPSCPGW